MSAERTLDWSKMLDEALTMPGDVGSVYCRFYNYSFLNQTLLRMQGISEPVNTYARWAAMGRQVLKGSKAAEILRPITVKREVEGEDELQAYTRFKFVKCLFPVSMTKGDPLPAAEPQRWDYRQAIKKLDITEVRFDSLNGNVQGYAYDRNLAINPVAAFPAKTRIHEIGHIVLGHTSESQQADYQQHRGVKEFQAESTAYLALNELEAMPPVAASASRGYIQHWLQGEQPGDGVIRQVFSAVDSILKAGRSAPE